MIMFLISNLKYSISEDQNVIYDREQMQNEFSFLLNYDSIIVGSMI